MAAFPPPPGASSGVTMPGVVGGGDSLFSGSEVSAPTWSGSQPVAGTQAVGSGYERFSFRSVFGRLELRSLLREDVERIKAQVDVQALTKHVENIAFSEVRLDDVRNMSDEDFVKVNKHLLCEECFQCNHDL